MKFSLSLKEIKKILADNGVDSTIDGDVNTVVEGFGPIDTATSKQGVMLRAKAKDHLTQLLIDELNSKKVAAVITTEKLFKYVKAAPVLITENPRLAFSYVLGNKLKAKIHESATINECVVIGNNVTIGPNCILGSDGLSINRHNEKLINTTHIGGVIIHDNVIIGGNSVIVRAVMGDTLVGDYSVIAHGVSIGHGCKIGKRVKIGPGVVISGSCKIGDDVWIGPNVAIKESISIGPGAFIGIGSVVLKDIPAEVVAAGSPAKILKGSKQPW